jgi:hypothetical protein
MMIDAMIKCKIVFLFVRRRLRCLRDVSCVMTSKQTCWDPKKTINDQKYPNQVSASSSKNVSKEQKRRSAHPNYVILIEYLNLVIE